MAGGHSRARSGLGSTAVASSSDHSTPTIHLILFLAGSLGWIFVVSIAAGLIGALLGAPLDDPQATFELLGPGFVGATSTIQIVGLGAWALALVGILPLDPDRAPDLRRVLGLSAPEPAWFVAAVVGGLTIWTFPSWFAQLLADRLEQDSTVEILAEMLASAPLSDSWPLIAAIVVSAPIFEELIFRGYLWSVIDRLGPAIATLAATSALFVLFHLDLLQALALIPTALFFGLLRWGSGSIGPPMLAHLINNGVAVAATRIATDEPESLGGIPAALGLLVAVLAVLGAHASRRRSP